MLAMARYFLVNGAKKFITKYGKTALDNLKKWMRSNKEKVEKLKPTLKQEPVEDLPLFKEPKYDFSRLSKPSKTTKPPKKFNYDYLTKGNDISKGM